MVNLGQQKKQMQYLGTLVSKQFSRGRFHAVAGYGNTYNCLLGCGRKWSERNQRDTERISNGVANEPQTKPVGPSRPGPIRRFPGTQRSSKRRCLGLCHRTQVAALESLSVMGDCLGLVTSLATQVSQPAQSSDRQTDGQTDRQTDRQTESVAVFTGSSL